MNCIIWVMYLFLRIWRVPFVCVYFISCILLLIIFCLYYFTNVQLKKLWATGPADKHFHSCWPVTSNGHVVRTSEGARMCLFVLWQLDPSHLRCKRLTLLGFQLVSNGQRATPPTSGVGNSACLTPRLSVLTIQRAEQAYRVLRWRTTTGIIRLT